MIVDPLPHPVPEAARVELERLGARWRTLPLPQALRCAPQLRALAQQFADECAAGTPGAAGAVSGSRPAGTPFAARIPDLGPAAAYDQLVTLTYDVARHRAEREARQDREARRDREVRPDRQAVAASGESGVVTLAEELAALRRRCTQSGSVS